MEQELIICLARYQSTNNLLIKIFRDSDQPEILLEDKAIENTEYHIVITIDSTIKYMYI